MDAFPEARARSAGLTNLRQLSEDLGRNRLKGRSYFSSEEIARLRQLLREKSKADRAAQKRIRDQMRSIGFYVTDFDTSHTGFDEAALDAQIANGSIEVSDQGGRNRSASSSLFVSSETLGHRGAHDPEARKLREAAAAKYRPQYLDLLLVAEAPPAAIDRYFYSEDVQEQDSLFRYVVQGLLGVEPTRLGKGRLLEELRSRRVFLIDVSPDPFLGGSLTDIVPPLVERCLQLQPKAIILIKATVYDAAFRALREAGLPVIDQRIPFPGSGRQREFLTAFRHALDQATDRIRETP